MPPSDRQQHALVTGAAGFIGGHLSRTLLDDGWHVVGVDCFSDYYDTSRKRRVAARLSENHRFELVEADLSTADPQPWLDRAEVVFHLAGQPGVRGSWADGFERYVTDNVLATQRLLEGARSTGVNRFVFASSSSVYGNADEYPCTELTLPRPHSPYGVTKLAAEHLCRLYAETYEVPTVSLRYFTVYGPGQRPDMALSRLITAAMDGRPFPMYGSGEQERDVTYVSDVVAATIAAGTRPVDPGAVFNVCGGSTVSLVHLLELVEEFTGRRVLVERRPGAAGDVRLTSGDNSAAARGLDWSATVSVRQGVRSQAASVATPDAGQSDPSLA